MEIPIIPVSYFEETDKINFGIKAKLKFSTIYISNRKKIDGTEKKNLTNVKQ